MSKKTTIQSPYWIIVSYKKNTIWGYPYLSEATCYNEYKTKMDELRKENGNEYMKKVDWKMEKHFYETIVEDAEAEKEFAKF